MNSSRITALAGFSAVTLLACGAQNDQPSPEGPAPRAVSWSALCERTRATVVQESIENGTGGTVIADALKKGCGSMLTVSTAPATGPSNLFDTSTGQPTAPQELLVVSGGGFVQPMVKYLEERRVAPLHYAGNETRAILRRGDDAPVLDVPLDLLTASHDYAIIELVPTANDSLVLVSYGFYSPGTKAAAWYFANRLFSERATAPGAWRVVEWTDSNGDGQPNETDQWSTAAQDNRQ